MRMVERLSNIMTNKRKPVVGDTREWAVLHADRLRMRSLFPHRNMKVRHAKKIRKRMEKRRRAGKPKAPRNLFPEVMPPTQDEVGAGAGAGAGAGQTGGQPTVEGAAGDASTAVLHSLRDSLVDDDDEDAKRRRRRRRDRLAKAARARQEVGTCSAVRKAAILVC